MNNVMIQRHLEADTSRFLLRRRASGPVWEDEGLHRSAFEQEPDLYALQSLSEAVQPGQRMRVTYQLLRSSCETLSADARQTIDRAVRVLLALAPADDVLTVFLALRRARRSGKHATRHVLRYILNHPRLEDLARRRRRAVVDCLEHALGRNVARGCAKMIHAGDAANRYVVRHLLRFAADTRRAASAVEWLYYKDTLPALPAVAHGDGYDDYHKKFLPERPAEAAMPKTVTATNRGAIAATLVRMYRRGDREQLIVGLECYVEQAVPALPVFEGSVALVLDASVSTRGYGEREFCSISQAVALRMVFERCCRDLRVYQVGGRGDPPEPCGATDLVSPLLSALEDDPDVVVIVSDGYENAAGGDLARVVATLPTVGVYRPVVFCQGKFTENDNLDYRRPDPSLPEVGFWHERDFRDVLWAVFSMASGGAGRRFLRDVLSKRLTDCEAEVCE